MAINVHKFDNFITAMKDQDIGKLLKELNQKNLKSSKESVDYYLIENVLPVLFAGLEELSKEVERFQNQDDINIEIRQRFNPCLFLAQYLMRNNPKYQNQDEIQKVKEFLRKEQIRRYIFEIKDQLKKIFQKQINTDTEFCKYEDLLKFSQKIDTEYQLNRDYTSYLETCKDMKRYREQKQLIPFDEILEKLVECTPSQISVEHFQNIKLKT